MTTQGAGEGGEKALHFQVSAMMDDVLAYVPQGLRARVSEDLATLPRRDAVQIVAGYTQYSAQMLERSQAGAELRRQMPQHYTTLAAGLAASSSVLLSVGECGSPEGVLSAQEVGDLNEVMTMCRQSWEGLATFARR